MRNNPHIKRVKLAYGWAWAVFGTRLSTRPIIIGTNFNNGPQSICTKMKRRFPIKR